MKNLVIQYYIDINLYENPKFNGNSSTASIILWILNSPGVHVVAFVPSAGPVPPPIIVVVPLQIASIACWGEIKWIWLSIVPAVQIVCSPEIISVFDIFGKETSISTGKVLFFLLDDGKVEKKIFFD